MSRSKRKVILYIDDEIAQCQLVGELLTERGMDIVFAFSGEEALEILSKIKVDLIFLDLRMPKMSGKEFLKYLENNKIKTPVIVISGYPDEIADLEEGAFKIEGFFVKPVQLEELYNQTREILDLQ